MRYYSSTAPVKKLSVAVEIADTEIALTDDIEGNTGTTGLPTSYPFTLVLDPDTSSEEIVLVTGPGSSKTYAVTRGTGSYQGVVGGNGTQATTHAVSAFVKHMVTARDLQEPQTHMNASSGVHGVTGSVVGTSDTQTLTHKTIDSSNNDLTIAQSDVTDLSSSLALKAPLANPTFTGAVTLPSGATGVTIGNVNGTEISYLDGVTSNIQTQLNAKADLANPVFTTGIGFEGSTANDFETTLTVTDPTADRTITLPNASGTVAFSDNMRMQTTMQSSDVSTTSTTWVDGIYISFVAPPSGAVAFAHSAFIDVTSGNGGALALHLTNSSGSSDVSNWGSAYERGLILAQENFGNCAMGATAVTVGQLVPGTIYKISQAYRAVSGGAGPVIISNRELSVIPSL